MPSLSVSLMLVYSIVSCHPEPMYTFSKLTYLLMLSRYRDFKCGSHNPEKPQEHGQGAGMQSFKHSSPAGLGLERQAWMSLSVTLVLSNLLLGFREVQPEKWQF